MYQQLTANDHRKFLGHTQDYTVDGLFVVGMYKVEKETTRLQSILDRYPGATMQPFAHEFLRPGMEVNANGKRLWFFVVYGGTLLSEYVHLGCLFGSKKNILSGVCGGLLPRGKAGDIILPTASSSDGSTVYMYDRGQHELQPSDDTLRAAIKDELSAHGYEAKEGKTVTCQAMLGETSDDVQKWSQQGYLGVEMEAATVFAVSNYFHVPSAAILSIADNLIEHETVLSENYETSRQLRQAVRDVQFEAVAKILLN